MKKTNLCRTKIDSEKTKRCVVPTGPTRLPKTRNMYIRSKRNNLQSTRVISTIQQRHVDVLGSPTIGPICSDDRCSEAGLAFGPRCHLSLTGSVEGSVKKNRAKRTDRGLASETTGEQGATGPAARGLCNHGWHTTTLREPRRTSRRLCRVQV